MYERVAVLDNEIQARLLASLLDEEDIPHTLQTYHDSAYDGLFQTQMGWGHVEAPSEYRARIEEIISDIKASSEQDE